MHTQYKKTPTSGDGYMALNSSLDQPPPSRPFTTLTGLPGIVVKVSESVGVAQSQGKRPEQQDTFATLTKVDEFFQLPKFAQIIALANYHAILQHQLLTQKICTDAPKTGSTASSITTQLSADGKKVQACADYIGDSASYLVFINPNTKHWRWQRISEPHDFTSKTETARVDTYIEDAKKLAQNESLDIAPRTFSGYGDILRLRDGSAMTRAFGHSGGEMYGLSRTPGVNFVELDIREGEIVFAVNICDGITDLPEFQQLRTDIQKANWIAALMEHYVSTERKTSSADIAIQLVNGALYGGSEDNVTTAVNRVARATRTVIHDGHGHNGAKVSTFLTERANACFLFQIQNLSQSLKSENPQVRIVFNHIDTTVFPPVNHGLYQAMVPVADVKHIQSIEQLVKFQMAHLINAPTEAPKLQATVEPIPQTAAPVDNKSKQNTPSKQLDLTAAEPAKLPSKQPEPVLAAAPAPSKSPNRSPQSALTKTQKPLKPENSSEQFLKLVKACETAIYHYRLHAFKGGEFRTNQADNLEKFIKDLQNDKTITNRELPGNKTITADATKFHILYNKIIATYNEARTHHKQHQSRLGKIFSTQSRLARRLMEDVIRQNDDSFAKYQFKLLKDFPEINTENLEQKISLKKQ